MGNFVENINTITESLNEFFRLNSKKEGKFVAKQLKIPQVVSSLTIHEVSLYFINNSTQPIKCLTISKGGRVVTELDIQNLNKEIEVAYTLSLFNFIGSPEFKALL